MSSPAKSPGSKAASSPEKATAREFKTITSDDWRRSLASARQRKNVISEQIRTRTSSSSPKTK
ncbi:MAG: hypothetical protein ACKODK_15120 [Opitutaceae bacterium]